MPSEQHGFSTVDILIGAQGNTSLIPTLTLTIGGSPTGGTYRLFLGNQFVDVAYNANAAAIQTALNSISNGFGAVVTGTGPFTVQLLVPFWPLTASGANLTGGTSPTASVSTWTLPRIAAVQSAGLDITYDPKDVMQAAQLSVFGTDVAFHGGKAVSSISVQDLDRILVEQTLNALKSTAGGVDTYTIQATTTPITFRTEMYGIDSKGKFLYVVGTRCYSKGLQDAYKLQDIADRKFDINYIADPNAPGATGYGIVLTLAMEQ